MIRRTKFLIVLLLLISSTIFAQFSSRAKLTPPRPVLYHFRAQFEQVITTAAAKRATPGISNIVRPRIIPADYFTKNFGFFCGKELQVEKVTKIPFRFRLGSLAYCNALEGK